jgi:hypothetical protein
MIILFLNYFLNVFPLILQMICHEEKTLFVARIDRKKKKRGKKHCKNGRKN